MNAIQVDAPNASLDSLAPLLQLETVLEGKA